MRSRFIISESDRQSILSMYGLLTEEKRIVKITGKTIASGVPIGMSVVELLDKDKKPLTPITKAKCDIDGNYEINTELDNGKYYLSALNTGEGYSMVYKEFNINSDKNDYTIDIEFELKGQKEIKIVQKKPNISGKVTNTNGKSLRSVNITWKSDKKSGTIEQERNGTYSSEVPLNFTITFERPNYKSVTKQISIDPKNNQKVLDVTLNPNIIIKVIDSVTKEPIKDARIQELSKKTEHVTDENGNTKLEGDYEFVSLVVRKDNYKTKTEEFDISQKPENIVIKLQSKTGGDLSVTDEILDTFKDSMFNIYGRGKTDISNKEAIRIAKVDAIDKFIKKHKRVYGKIDIKNLDPDIKYELTYGRPLSKSEKIGEYKYILKFSKKDIKQYLSQFLEKEGIQIENQPFEFEKATLDEAINDAYMNRKELMIVLGISNDEDTIDLVKELKGGGIDKKYLPIFIKVDRNDKDYLKLNNIAKFDSYPRIIILKPETPNNVKVVNSDFKINQKDADEMK